MFEYIHGKIEEINPVYVVLSCGGIGYFIHISLNTYSSLNSKSEAKLFIHQIIREDAHLLVGFDTKYEREIFRHLISVSGVGTSTALMILSSMTPEELHQAIAGENVDILRSVKGIGVKTAQRIIIELKDKLTKEMPEVSTIKSVGSSVRQEAATALVTLGFNKSQVEKVLNQVIKETPGLGVEELIKKALKHF